MKNLKFIIPTILLSVLLINCSDDDDTPEPVNEEEVITTVIVNLVNGTNTVTLTSRDTDGDGPNPPVETIVGEMKSGTTYTGTVRFLNETETPSEEITDEVEEEDDEHQVFVIPSSGLNLTSTATNNDGNGNPLGTKISVVTGAMSSGNLNITLRHEPNKPNDGTLADAGGETDVSVNFDVEIID
ncbi:hypothetical protein ULMS_18240 [Patiriisocius marinistellae]|uniref:Type 1 periplasmic binding fold superfamily protein n=1 Tax=Patiriisocius marinistellae TaxID=2494560 RepID=A0A5J4G1C7_9FLAO|nr:type 1 periplasmic binding fold superfamily protein [Patiriisocius marinistellae]GEQ86316.1 hypothetical protein ULMS_18240 [Patiriisocius marinistellae]